jgi:hypothetical protein
MTDTEMTALVTAWRSRASFKASDAALYFKAVRCGRVGEMHQRLSDGR